MIYIYFHTGTSCLIIVADLEALKQRTNKRRIGLSTGTELISACGTPHITCSQDMPQVFRIMVSCTLSMFHIKLGKSAAPIVKGGT